MIKNYFLAGLFTFFTFSTTIAQTGPGGVGSTGSNGTIGLWLRADNITGTANNTTLSLWPDASGRGNSAAQTTANNRPLYLSSSTFNNRPAVRFDGTNDMMTVASTPILNGSGTNAVTYFAVIRMRNLSTFNPSGILSKRATNSGTINSNYAYNLYVDPNTLYYDVASGNTRQERQFETDYFNNDNYIVGFRFDGTQTNTERGALYDGEFAPDFYTHSITSINNSSAPLTIGALAANSDSYANMDVAEIIQLNRSINNAERIILENYLSSKYDIFIDANDRYAYDNPGNNYYGNDVTGIGRSAGTQQTDAVGTGMVRISNASNLNANDEFLFWGHNGLALTQISTNVPTAYLATGQRLARLWRLDETNNVGNVTVTFDVSALPSITSANSQYLRLFVDGDGNFNNATLIAPESTNFTGNDRLVSFRLPSTNISSGNYFTLGTINSAVTPLPVTFVSFDANNQSGSIELKWYTASEENNHYFTIERSQDGKEWEVLNTLQGAGNSNQVLGYKASDPNPYVGTSYYRIKQTDYDEQFSYSRVATVTVFTNTSEVTISPNPVKGDILHMTFAEELQINQISLTNMLGQEVYHQNVPQVRELEINTQAYVNGTYFVTVKGNTYTKTTRILITR